MFSDYTSEKIKKKNHTCRKNWWGSSKAMEPDMIVEMIKSISSDIVKVKTIVGDEDSTNIAKAIKEIDKDM